MKKKQSNWSISEAKAHKKYEFISEHIRTLKNYLQQNFSMKEDLVREISLARQDFSKEINQSKVDMIKWMFDFWFTLVLLLLANWFLKH